jgi:hypothetical protein
MKLIKWYLFYTRMTDIRRYNKLSMKRNNERFVTQYIIQKKKKNFDSKVINFLCT